MALLGGHARLCCGGGTKNRSLLSLLWCGGDLSAALRPGAWDGERDAWALDFFDDEDDEADDETFSDCGEDDEPAGHLLLTIPEDEELPLPKPLSRSPRGVQDLAALVVG
mmetsp:Transcript_7411/g.22846  ORF Transcript_7411/g.22846 Transcript_7411/m.22846 type:complete len:110 (-) Transcript_7411:305-634(-)